MNSAALREACRRFSFVKDFKFIEKVFKPYASLRSIRPEDGGFRNKPYKGRRFDEKKWVIVEGGWNHDHCNLCSECIDEGDPCWTNRRSVTILCQRCFNLFKDKIEKQARLNKGEQGNAPS